MSYQVETTEGKEWIARFPQHGNVGGSGKTEQEAIDDAIENLRFEMSDNAINEEDWSLIQSEASKLGLDVVRKTDIPEGHEKEYMDLSEINILNVLSIPHEEA